MSLLILNGTVVNEGTSQEFDLLIEDGRIAQIGKDLQSLSAKQVIDASGKLVIPGMIDDQVHFREPGLVHKGGLFSESRAAVAGGITSFMDMPNVSPTTTTIERLEEKFALAAGKCAANYAFYMGAANDNLEEIKKLKRGFTCGIKIFMGASTGNMLVDDEEILNGIFKHAQTIVITHCEDTPLIKQNEEIYRQKYGEDIPLEFHPVIRSAEACYKSTEKAIRLAKTHGTRLHVLHLTTEKELELFQQGPIEDKQITLEVCVHHTYFSEEDYAERGAFIKCNPAIKKKSDRDALVKALNNDVIDILATDHAPHLREEKQGTYFKTAAGLPLVQYVLPCALEHVHEGRISIEKLSEPCRFGFICNIDSNIGA